MSNFYHGLEPGRRRRSLLRRPRRTLTHLISALGSDLLPGINSPTFAVPASENTAPTPHPTLTPQSSLFRQQG